MGMRQGSFGWMWRPQAVVCFIVLCLCVAALSTVARSVAVIEALSPAGPQRVEDADVERLPRVDCFAKPCLALTFDDGPSETTTPQVLDILAKHQVKATFFVVGQQVAGREALLRREYREGHEIGNHTWNHPDLTKLTPAAAEEQIRSTQKAITAAGVPAPRLVRPPYGAIDDMVAAHARLTVIRWNIDTEDWKEKDPGKVHFNMLRDARPGGIILMHDTEHVGVTALEPAIMTLKPYYQFVTVSQLLDLSPGDQGQYFGRK